MFALFAEKELRPLVSDDDQQNIVTNWDRFNGRKSRLEVLNHWQLAEKRGQNGHRAGARPPLHLPSALRWPLAEPARPDAIRLLAGSAGHLG